MKKQCFKCGEVKDLSCFYRHPQMGDGHVNKCKECNKKDVRENRKSKVDYYREYDRDRGSRQTKEYRDAYKAEKPVAYAARTAVGNAIRRGAIKRKPCEICGATEHIHAHHDDYKYALDVRWLCPVHHKEWHDKNGEAPNAREVLQ